MEFRKIVFFAALLFVLQVTASTIINVILGDATSIYFLIHYVSGFLIAACVFAYMTWAYPIKPYLSAFTVGVLAHALGMLVTVLILGYWYWSPGLLLIDVAALFAAIMLGVSAVKMALQ